MPKMKTHKGILRRVKLTGKGKIRHRHPNAGHLLSGKSGDRRRRLRKPGVMTGAIAKQMKAAMGSH
jgi:large subunit ribosomal protein L35